jgi:hypothetical protein
MATTTFIVREPIFVFLNGWNYLNVWNDWNENLRQFQSFKKFKTFKPSLSVFN